MIEVQQIINLEPDGLVNKVYELHSEGYRLVQINCSKLSRGELGDGLEINYTFDKEYAFVNIRLNVPLGAEITSISGIYFPAFLYENEMHDLFGLNVKHMKLDYNGNLYKTTVKTPFVTDNALSNV